MHYCHRHLEVDLLDIRINELKEELIQVAGAAGLNSPDTLRCSQELDQLIIFKMKNLKNLQAAELA
ncbi:aspartyl-phosphate phosphatase Spo0E family protein [Bacillus sp. V3B]|nr:aspartyl-phosphate phosphatase Spo0E family protein [Bacillus sp. V3B]